MLTEASRRRDFPSLAEQAYLNTAAEGIPSPAVAAALVNYARDKSLGFDGRERHEAERRLLLHLVAELFQLSNDEVGLCSCTSEAYNLLATAIHLVDGDEVIVNDLDFPAGVTPWLQQNCSATVRVWRSHSGALDVDDLIPLLGPRTRLVTASLVSFYNGYRLPMPAVVAAMRHHSPALLAVDVTQALGRVEFDAREADFIVSSTHKWILGSHGGGFVGIPRRRSGDLTSAAGGWFHLDSPFDESRFERAVSQPGAASYAVGMPNYAAIYANRAALEYLVGVTVAAIEKHANPLVEECYAALRRMDVELLTPASRDDQAGIIAFRHPRATQIAELLRSRNIHVMYHAGRIRVAIHGYNTPDDVSNLLNAIQEGVRHA